MSLAQDAPPASDAKHELSKLERANVLREIQLGKGALAEPLPSPDQDLTSTALRMFQSLGIILGCFLIGAWAYKKYILKEVGGVSASRIKVLERMSVSTRGTVILSEIDGKKILIGITPQSINFLDLTSGSSQQSTFNSSSPSFIQTLTEEIK
jgi:flagellar biogenesis protein FliO